MGLRHVFLATVFGLSCNFAWAQVSGQGPAAADSSITMKLVAGEKDRFAFEFCASGSCRPIGSSAGYSFEQLDSLRGGWQELGAGALGLGEATLGSALDLSTLGVLSPFVTELLSSAGIRALGYVLPAAAYRLREVADARTGFEIGQQKSLLRSSARTLVTQGGDSVVLYQSPDPAKALEVADAIAGILADL